MPPQVRLLVALLGVLAAEPPTAADHGPLEITQRLPERVDGATPFAVEVLVRNTGGEAVNGVVVNDDLPPGFELRDAVPPASRVGNQLSWAVGRLGPGEQRSLRLTLAARPAPDQTAFRHAVEVAYQGRLTAAQTVPLTRPVLEVSIAAPAKVVVGAPTDLSFVVRNSGTAAAAGVVLQTQLPAGLNSPQGNDLETNLGALAPGQSRTVPLSVVAAREGDVVLRVTAQAEPWGSASAEARFTAEVVRLVLAGHGPPTLPEQFAGLFEMTVRNDQAEAARGVVLSLTLPSGLAFLRASDGGSYDDRTHSVRWDLGDLAPGSVRTVAWNATALQAGEQAWAAHLQAGTRTYPDVRCSSRVVPAAPPATPPPRP